VKMPRWNWISHPRGSAFGRMMAVTIALNCRHCIPGRQNRIALVAAAGTLPRLLTNFRQLGRYVLDAPSPLDGPLAPHEIGQTPIGAAAVLLQGCALKRLLIVWPLAPCCRPRGANSGGTLAGGFGCSGAISPAWLSAAVVVTLPALT
jgi:hypothetical protein